MDLIKNLSLITAESAVGNTFLWIEYHRSNFFYYWYYSKLKHKQKSFYCLRYCRERINTVFQQALSVPGFTNFFYRMSLFYIYILCHTVFFNSQDWVLRVNFCIPQIYYVFRKLCYVVHLWNIYNISKMFFNEVIKLIGRLFTRIYEHLSKKVCYFIEGNRALMYFRLQLLQKCLKPYFSRLAPFF